MPFQTIRSPVWFEWVNYNRGFSSHCLDRDISRKRLKNVFRQRRAFRSRMPPKRTVSISLIEKLARIVTYFAVQCISINNALFELTED
jgi:hypothetical protein